MAASNTVTGHVEELPSLVVLNGATVYAPEPLGVADVVIIGEKIVWIGDAGDLPGSWKTRAQTIEASGLRCAPGFVDNHTHFAGGGGMGGYTTRPPALGLSHFARAGITTVVGCLGADSVTRHAMDLLASARGLAAQGLTAHVLIGGTGEHPVQPLTGEIKRDIVLIPEVLGVGEISISELGASIDSLHPVPHYVFEVAAQAMIAGRIAGKRGIVLLQVPTGGRGLAPLLDGLAAVNVPAVQFLPSHANSHPEYLQQAVEFVRRGGYLDIGTSHTPHYGFRDGLPVPVAMRAALDAGVSIDRMLMSSDANGVSLLRYLPIESLLAGFQDVIRIVGLPFEDALRTVTTNPADALGLPHKGRLRVGGDADIVLFSSDLELRTVIARGRVLLQDGEARAYGPWERR